MLAPICPHFCEHVWGTLLGHGKGGAASVTRAPWPSTTTSPPNPSLLAADDYFTSKLHAIRLSIAKATVGKPGKAPKAGAPPAGPKANGAIILVAHDWPQWQKGPLGYLAGLWTPPSGGALEGSWSVADPVSHMKEYVLKEEALKPFTKKIMPILALAIGDMKGKRELSNLLAFKPPFDEGALWRDNLEYVKKSLELQHVEVVMTDDERVAGPEAAKLDPLGKAKAVVPMEPDVIPIVKGE